MTGIQCSVVAGFLPEFCFQAEQKHFSVTLSLIYLVHRNISFYFYEKDERVDNNLTYQN